MRFSIIIIFVLGAGFFTYGQKSDTLRKYFDSELYFTSKNKAVYGGIAIKSDDHWLLVALYADTGLLVKAYFKDRALTIKDGPFSLYHIKNIKAIEGTYLNNTKQGIWKFWYENGHLMDSGMVKNNQLVNSWYSWYETGRLKTITHYQPMDSLVDNLSANSSIKKRSNRIWGDDDSLIIKLHGISVSYYESGLLKDSGNYINGEKQGEWINLYENGKIESKGAFSNGLREGEWNYYYEKGMNSTKEHYKKNKVVGLECFDELGRATGIFCSILKPPVAIIDRNVDFNNYMLDHIFWPKELDGKNVNGNVRASYTISKEGRLISFIIVESPHELLGKEVERFFRSIEKWSPAILHNRTTEFTVTIEIPFYR